jgi:hypothetical protein
MPKILLRPALRIKRLASEEQLIARQLDEAQAGRGQVLVPVASVVESPESETAAEDTTRQS